MTYRPNPVNATTSAPSGPRPPAAFGVVLAATAATLIQWTLVAGVGGVDLLVRVGGAPDGAPGSVIRRVGPGSVGLATLAAGLAGWGLLAMLRRHTRHPARWWTASALVVLVVSLTGPLAATTLTGGLTLAGFHLLAAAVLVPGLLRVACLLGGPGCGGRSVARAPAQTSSRL